MNITLFISSLKGGGAERQIAEMANLFSNHGHSVSLVTYSDLEDDYKVCSCVRRVRLGENKGKIYKWLAILRYFLTTGDDGIISFFPGCTRFVVLSTLLRYRRPFKIIAGERAAILKPSKLQLQMIKSLYRYVDYIVANSYTQAQQIIHLNPKLVSKTLTISNYANIGKYTQVILKKNDVLRIAITAHYRPEKNCMGLLQAINMLRNKTKVHFKFEWYGRIYPDVYHSCKQYIEDNSLHEYIELMDRVSDVPGLLKDVDVLCLPSKNEGFSNSITEAICMGLPVLASDISDNSLMVHDGINGFLFDPYDIDNMCVAFIRFFELSFDERVAMGKESRRIAEELFNEEKFVNSYINLLVK